MELALKKVGLSGYSLDVNTSLFTEETLECIVPDACPDILRILKTDAIVCIKSKEVREGHLEIRGGIQTQILYIPEGEEKIYRMEVSLPFSVCMDHTAIHAEGSLFVVPRLINADTRILNPRKVYVRAEAMFVVSCYAPFCKSMVTGCDGGTDRGVQEKYEQISVCSVKLLQNKSFTYADKLSLPGNKPDLESLLSYQVEISCAEHKIIGSRLIFKGTTTLELLYQSQEGTLIPVTFELPFSQMMEVADTEEDAECELSIIPTEVICKGDKEEPRMLSVSLGYLAQAIVWQKQKIEVLSDIYSTQYECASEILNEEFCHKSGREVVVKNVREMVELPVPANQILESQVTVRTHSHRLEGKELKLSADLRVSILYQGDNGEYYYFSCPLTVEDQASVDPGSTYYSECRCTGERYVTPAGNGAEVRLSVEVIYKMQTFGQVDMVSAANLEEDLGEQISRPSVILRLAGRGESLWDIAKAYITTESAILEANELSESDAIEGRMLLIPKKR